MGLDSTMLTMLGLMLTVWSTDRPTVRGYTLGLQTVNTLESKIQLKALVRKEIEGYD